MSLMGCANTPAPEVFNPIEYHFQNTLMAPSGFSRVYILSPIDGAQDLVGHLYIGTAEDNKALAFTTKNNDFIAFDIKPGTYLIDFKPEDYMYFEESKSFTLLERQTLVLRPIAHFSGNVLLPPSSGDGAGVAIELALDAALLPVYGILSIFATREPEFEILDVKTLQNIRSKKLSPLLPTAPSYVQQGPH